MSIVFRELDDCSQVDQSKFATENWYLMGWGMGDAINATLFLESQSPVPYKILCPPRNFTGIKFILDNFIPGTPKCDEVVIYPKQDGYPIDQDEVIMSKDGFGPQSINIAHKINKLKVMHYPPKDWWRVQQLEDSKILDKIIQYENVEKTIEEKTCILFPECGDSFQLPDEFWNTIIRAAKDKGYRVYTNWTNKSDVFFYQKILDGTEKFDKVELQDLCGHLVKYKNLVTIGLRTGIFDFLKFFEFRKIQFYPDLASLNRKDATRALYEWCNLENDIYTKNSIELKLSQYKSEILDLIIP
jgi:hypothetical protein